MPFDGSAYDLLAKRVRQPSFVKRLWDAITFKAEKQAALKRVLEAYDETSVPVVILRIGEAMIQNREDWIQRRYETIDGRHCAVGAIRAAANLIQASKADRNAAHFALLRVAVYRGFTGVEKMNDHSSHDSVLSAFSSAIQRERQATR